MITKLIEIHIRYTKKVVLSIITGFFLISLAITVYFLIQERQFVNKIYPQVYLDNLHIGGKTKQEIVDQYEKKYSFFKEIQVTVQYNDEVQATFSAQQMNLHSNSKEVVERAFLVGRSSKTTSRLYQKVATIFNLAKFRFTTDIAYDRSLLEDFITTIEERYNTPAKNALFSFENGRVVSFRKEEAGRRIQTDKFFADMDFALHKLDETSRKVLITLTSQVIQPEIILSQANQFGIEELIGEGKSNFSHSIPERIHNIKLAASKFNGVLIPKDSIFSFNEIVGDISSRTGYKPAYIIMSGKTVLGDGGGVCQVSTTLFRAALYSGLPIIERTAHAYRVLYYENDAQPGFDATVFAPSVDLKIKNDTPSYILIQTSVDTENNILTFKFYGKKDNRKVDISPVSLSEVSPPPPPLYQDDATLKKGVMRQIDFSAWGGKSQFTYTVSREEKIVFQKQFFSSYRPWQAVYLVGTAD